MYAQSTAYGCSVANRFQASAKRVMSLKEPHLKMSKSHPDPRSRILINDSPNIIEEKVKLALTDSAAGISYDPFNRPGVSNLLAMMKYMSSEQRSLKELAEEHHALSMREFKNRVAEAISEGLSNVRSRYNRLISNSSETLEDVAVQGADSARKKANETLKIVRNVIGLQ